MWLKPSGNQVGLPQKKPMGVGQREVGLPRCCESRRASKVKEIGYKAVNKKI